MTIEFELTPEDYAAYAWYHHSQPGAAAGNMRRLRYGFSMAYLVFFLVGLALGPTPADFAWLILAVLWFITLPWFYRSSARRNVKRIAQQGLCRGSVGPHRLDITAEGVTHTTPYFVWTTFWAGVERVVKLPERILIYVGPNAAFQVPRRAFENDAAFDACVADLKAALAKVAA